MLEAKVFHKTLHFKHPAGTSRGVYRTRDCHFVMIKSMDTGQVGFGECSPLPALSCDDVPNYTHILEEAAKALASTGILNRERLLDFPSILFGLECALLNMLNDSPVLFESPFTRAEESIEINGLIWMGTFEEMYTRIREKLDQGYRCLKLKIGAIDFEKEIELLRFVRKNFSADLIELRVDANGAFSPLDAPEKLKRLSEFSIHSIEQPIRAGQWEEMARLCENSPIPIALDEELIGINRAGEKRKLLDTIRPQYIILKPTLHGAISGAQEWIKDAEERRIGWWATSALESNIGLSAIAQWTSSLHPKMPQGLGTGALFTDNIEMPLKIEHGRLHYIPQKEVPNILDWLLA